MRFCLHNFAIVVPCIDAIFDKVSPDLTLCTLAERFGFKTTILKDLEGQDRVVSGHNKGFPDIPHRYANAQ